MSSSLLDDPILFFEHYETSKALSNVDMNELLFARGLQIVRYADALFLGQLSAGYRHGLGILVTAKGYRYEGEWLNDQK